MAKLKELEKPPLSSKKFIAYLVAEATWKIILAGGISGAIYIASQGHRVPVWLFWVLLAVVIIAGFVEAGFIGGQAWLDKYVRVAKITAAGPKGSVPVDNPVENTNNQE